MREKCIGKNLEGGGDARVLKEDRVIGKIIHNTGEREESMGRMKQKDETEGKV